jgi:hypothetical protein
MRGYLLCALCVYKSKLNAWIWPSASSSFHIILSRVFLNNSWRSLPRCIFSNKWQHSSSGEEEEEERMMRETCKHERHGLFLSSWQIIFKLCVHLLYNYITISLFINGELFFSWLFFFFSHSRCTLLIRMFEPTLFWWWMAGACVIILFGFLAYRDVSTAEHQALCRHDANRSLRLWHRLHGQGEI